MKTLIKNIKMWLLLPGLVAMTSACDDFLEEPPKKQTNLEITTVEQLDGLLVNMGDYVSTDTWILATDMFGLSWQAKKAGKDGPFYDDVLFGLWEWEDAAQVDEDEAYPDIYSKIFTANTVLANVGNVSGDESLKADVKAAAHYWRALYHWLALNAYALPYTEENMQEPGIPYKMTINFEEPIGRKSLEECYRLIEEDLMEALKISTQDVEKNWRVNVAGVNAFLARFYFYQNKYDKALEHANKALASTKVRLVDYNDPEQMYFDDEPFSVAIGEPLTVPFTFRDRAEYYYVWPETYINCRFTYGFNASFLSDECISLYNKDTDLRYKFCIHPEFSRFHSYPQDIPVAAYILWYTNVLGGPSIQEMLLTKAECLARQGDVSNAMAAVNQLRAKRIVPGADRDLTASTPEEAVKKIIDERIRELHLTTRWWDMRRLNHNETTYDDFVAVRKYLPHDGFTFDRDAEPIEYKLEPGSRKYALPFNINDINLSEGQLEQNKY